jgi:hypothetical protein
MEFHSNRTHNDDDDEVINIIMYLLLLEWVGMALYRQKKKILEIFPLFFRVTHVDCCACNYPS